MNDCPHLHVEIHTRLWAMETRYEPAEYEQRAQCLDCGKWMDVADVPAEAEASDDECDGPAGTPTLSDQQLLRYSRQIFLPEIDHAGQQRLAAARVMVLGLGGLGSPAATYLAGAGVGQLVLVDPDKVDLSNLHRQILHRSTGVGLAKVESAKRSLHALNPDIDIVTHAARLTGQDLAEAVRGVDLVVDGTDNFESRFELNRVCVAERRSLVYGAVVGMEGQASLFRADLDDSR